MTVTATAHFRLWLKDRLVTAQPSPGLALMNYMNTFWVVRRNPRTTTSTS